MREDWIECTLGEVCFTTSGGTPSRQNKDFYKGNIPWIKSGELDKGIIYDSEEHISEEAIKKSSAKIFPKGTLLFALYGATIGKMATLGVDAATNQAICGIYKSDVFNSEYLYNFLFSQKNFLIQQGIGGAQPNISQTILKKLNISIAPLVEQKAIVNKIEELFSSLDSGIADLKKAQGQLVIYRQAVLKKAFEGAYSDKEYKIVTIDTLCEVVRGGSPRPAGDERFYNGDIPFMKVRDISRNIGIYVDNAEHSIKEAGLKKTRFVDANTLLLTNSGATLGIPAITTINTTFNDGIAAFLYLDDDLRYHYYYWCSKTVYLRNLNQGAAQPNLNTSVIGKMEIPIYEDKDEHKKIVQEIESRLSVCDTVEKDIAGSLDKAQALRQSILKKAFEGTLLGEAEIAKCKADKDYEPASVLLERIKKKKNKK
ncbi:restriction endonuclease subunit S [Winogradskyella schleiferi]|uniref:restriction endonuclease subunit S n=1 Tax=Winogradskyella schleiferi TaxID=2686078 RepID=UPI0015B97377|nr:restriction endonuclease subunit S [Winogradskyella schleiferi]